MDSTAFFSQLLILIQERIKETVPEIRYINQDLGQLEVFEMNTPSVSWPCLLVDFDSTSYSDMMSLEQEGEAMILLRLGFNPFSQTSNLQESNIRSKGLAYYEIEQKIFESLHGWQPLQENGEPLCQPLYRRGAKTERRDEDTFRVRMLSFSTSFHDDGAKPESTKVTRPDIAIDFELED